nr:hypothetical protein Iba_chr08dCG2930 [Ipomoea batatas]
MDLVIILPLLSLASEVLDIAVDDFGLSKLDFVLENVGLYGREEVEEQEEEGEESGECSGWIGLSKDFLLAGDGLSPARFRWVSRWDSGLSKDFLLAGDGLSPAACTAEEAVVGRR